MPGGDQRPPESLWLRYDADIGEVYEDQRNAYCLDLSYLSLIPGSIKLNGVASLVDPQGLTKFDKHGLQERVKDPNGSSREVPIEVTGKPKPDAAVAGAGAAGVAGAPPGSSGAGAEPPAPRSKRIKIDKTPSALAYIREAGRYLPGTCSDSKVAFYAGRQHAVAANVAPPALLCAPEFGIVHDAAHYSPTYSIAPDDYAMEVARDLSNKMAPCYALEEERQFQLVKWFNTHMQVGALLIVPPKSSAGAPDGTGVNDGQVVIREKGCDYLLLLSEVKNESGSAGDPLFQGLAYYQKFYKDGERWDKEELLRASGAPAFTLELQGCDLVIGAVYTVEGNVVVREPLTDKMTLLDLEQRMPVYLERLARVLAALRAAILLLTWRIKKLAGCEGLSSSQQTTNKELSRLPAAARQLVSAALEAASLRVQHSYQLAAGQTHLDLLWARLPYPLASMSMYPCVESLPRMASKAVFKCSSAGQASSSSAGQTGSISADQAGSTAVLVKFVQRPYPAEVHKLLHGLDLTPRLIDVQRLPGGWWMVVQEFLDVPWCTYYSFIESMPSPERQAVAVSAVSAAVGKMHTANVVHGDLRPPNVMLKESSPNTFEVKLIDLEWAGIEGEELSKYPLNMAPRSGRLRWHSTAGPGRALKKEHDEHLLQEHFQPI